jgi:hypothetical protein
MKIHIQLQQAISLFSLLLLAKYAASIYLSWPQIIAILSFTLVFSHLQIYLAQGKLDFVSFSSLTTAMGVMLMMVSVQLWIYAVIIGLGLLQKQWLCFEGRHFFNPSNFSLMLGLFLFYDDAHMVLGQLGDSLWLKIFVMVVAVAMLIRVQRWIIPLVFVAAYLLFQYIWVVKFDPVLTFEMLSHRFYAVSFILFIVFMLTDPKTTPTKADQQIWFSVILALIAVGLDRYYGFRVQHLFMALFLLSPLVPVLAVWDNTNHRNTWLLLSSVLLIITCCVVVYIGEKPPYYFEMNH